MKSCARSFVYWPQMDKEIEQVILTCEKCQQVRNLPPKAPVQKWINTNQPWHRIHID